MNYLDIQYSKVRVPETVYPAQLVSWLCKKVDRSSGRVVDVGCGRGDFTNAWAGLGFDTFGIDGVNAELGAALNFELDMFPVKPHSVDVVFCKSVIEHLHDPKPMLEEMRKCLRMDGRLIMMCPDWRSYWLNFWDDYTHRQPYDIVSLQDVLRSSGFDIVSAELIFQVPSTWYSKWHKLVADAVSLFVPLRIALFVSDRLGNSWLKWRVQKTVLVIARRLS